VSVASGPTVNTVINNYSPRIINFIKQTSDQLALTTPSSQTFKSQTKMDGEDKTKIEAMNPNGFRMG
jgi:hypothetical protein